MHTLMASLVVSALACCPARAASLTVIASFNGTNGFSPANGVLFDANGDLVGVAALGGAGGNGVGTIYRIARTESGWARALTVVFNFDGAHGSNPVGIIRDPHGRLLGTTTYGGAVNGGVAFQLDRANGVYASVPEVINTFPYGHYPSGPPIIDADRNMFGVTCGCVAFDAIEGTIWELVKTTTGWRQPLLIRSIFHATTGHPFGTLTSDAAGNLFGTTIDGGANGYGTIFELAPISGRWAYRVTVLASFDGASGKSVFNGVAIDAAGNLFGTAQSGGAYDVGTVFMLPKTATGYSSNPVVLLSFNGNNGASPDPRPSLDAAGNIFGTTFLGGSFGQGVLYEIPKVGGTYAAQSVTLVNFDGANSGKGPAGPLTSDAVGTLYGTTYQGGPGGYGTVFMVTNTGFKVN
jgi:uncharacterized repeat protein (TIGR03803 family)